MAGRRGSIPRRVPDPSRIPPRSQPEPDAEQRIVAKGGIPMFHDAGQITLGPGQTVTAFFYRFPSSGIVRMGSLRVRDMSDGVALIISIVLDGEEVSRTPWDAKRPILHFPETLPLDETMSLSVQLQRVGGESNGTVDVDLAYFFQETKPRAAVSTPAR